MYANAPAKCFSTPCKWRGGFIFIEIESQVFLEKPQERVKASQRSLIKRVKLFEDAKPKGSSFLKKLDKRVKLLQEAKQGGQSQLKRIKKMVNVSDSGSSVKQLAQLEHT